MSEPPPRAKRPDYGLDAPGVVRNLAIGGAAALVLAAAAFPLGWAPLARMATGAAIGCLFGAGWMVWGSKVEKVRERDRHLKQRGEWRDPGLQGTYFGSRADGYAGITLGLIGLGRIGSRIATLMRPWKMRILATDPYVPDAKFAEHGVTRVDLDTLLAESDVVSLHVVLTRETRHLIDAKQLAMMKPHAILINTSRGPCVHEPALIEALQRGQIAGAALDVFEQEPLSADSSLRNLGDKVLLSPHMVSSNVGSGLGPGIRWATESVLRAMRGEVPDNVYNKEVIPRWERRFGGTSVWASGSR